MSIRLISMAERRAAELKLRNAAAVTRYVVTHVGRDGLRTLSAAAQGRYTYATAAEAQEHLDATVANNSAERLASVFGTQAVGTFEVRACKCWPGHFDPKGIYFDDTDGES